MTGRRHVRDGSVHVTELISKRTRPLDSTGPLQDDPDQPAEGALDSLLDPAAHQPGSHRRPPSKGAQVAKIVGLGIASCVLCASIAIGSMITHQRQEGSVADAARPNLELSGEEALLPDLINEAVPGPRAAGAQNLPGAPTNATSAIENPGPLPPEPAEPPAQPAQPASEAESSTPNATGAPLSKREIVEHFYRLIPTWPDKAFTLLDGTLLGTNLGEFVRAWSSVTDISVLEVRDSGDNVLAVVRMRLPDGSFLRVQQLLEVANTVPRRIVGAQILSAQRN